MQEASTYRYTYEIADGDGDGDGQATLETREGKYAGDRYYVNSEQPSTDVKHFADEWGYHPLVKYGSANEQRSATTRFATGEQTAESLQDETVNYFDDRSRDSRRPFFSIGERCLIVCEIHSIN